MLFPTDTRTDTELQVLLELVVAVLNDAKSPHKLKVSHLVLLANVAKNQSAYRV